jgi:predicted nucleic acid-binding protein
VDCGAPGPHEPGQRAGGQNAVFSELSPDLDLIEDAVGLMRSLQHPIYDCLHLALGRRSKWPVLTADERLFAAGRRARIPVRLL